MFVGNLSLEEVLGFVGDLSIEVAIVFVRSSLLWKSLCLLETSLFR